MPADQPTTPTPETIKAVAAQDMPVPSPPGSGEVLANDPFPLTATSVENTPPVRDKNQSHAAWAPDGTNMDLLRQTQERLGCGAGRPTCEQAGTPIGACRCMREVLGSARMIGITHLHQVPPEAPNDE